MNFYRLQLFFFFSIKLLQVNGFCGQTFNRQHFVQNGIDKIENPLVNMLPMIPFSTWIRFPIWNWFRFEFYLRFCHFPCWIYHLMTLSLNWNWIIKVELSFIQFEIMCCHRRCGIKSTPCGVWLKFFINTRLAHTHDEKVFNGFANASHENVERERVLESRKCFE